MIKLQPRPEPPHYLHDEPVEALSRNVYLFYSTPEQKRRQHKFEFPLFPSRIFRLLLESLLAYSHGKCAYCETRLAGTKEASLERFRPKAGALDIDGTFSTEHYWWLAFDWGNLYPCCITCNKAKASKFPMQGPRIGPNSSYEDLIREPKLLIDPANDEPHEHLKFLANGLAEPLSVQGEATIATLELNRQDLVRRRADAAKRVQMLVRALGALGRRFIDAGEHWRERLEASRELAARRLFHTVADEAEFAAVARAVVERWMERDRQGVRHAMAPPSEATEPHARSPASIISSAKSRALLSQTITRVELKNFRGISALELPIDYSVGLGAPWTVLLGENGAGKSSILQAVALTLLQSDSQLPAIKPKSVLRKGARFGYVRVFFHGIEVPRQLTFRRGARGFERSGPQYVGTLLGYGATRLLPRGRDRSKHGTVRLQNMFDPFEPLLDANRWLGSLDKPAFDFVARALRDVLGLSRSATLRRTRAKGEQGVRLKQYGADLTLEDLSDGYQSALGLTCDIIASLRVVQAGALDASEAVVIIDELGAHLHPRWRMRIVTSLRSAFKRVQFIASTHDPLCLRGLENGEAVVLRRTGRGRVFRVPELPPVKGLRVDQLLTSDFFGLDSTLDPAIETRYRELYRLLAARETTETMKARIVELRAELAPYEVPGVTRRERRLLDVIDKELAQLDVTPDVQTRAEIRAENEAIIDALLQPRAAGVSR